MGTGNRIVSEARAVGWHNFYALCPAKSSHSVDNSSLLCRVAFYNVTAVLGWPLIHSHLFKPAEEIMEAARQLDLPPSEKAAIGFPLPIKMPGLWSDFRLSRRIRFFEVR